MSGTKSFEIRKPERVKGVIEEHFVNVNLICLNKDCKGYKFTSTYQGYAWIDEYLDLAPEMEWGQQHSESDPQVGDDWERSDVGWHCSDCYQDCTPDQNDALTEYAELHEYTPERAAEILLQKFVIKEK